VLILFSEVQNHTSVYMTEKECTVNTHVMSQCGLLDREDLPFIVSQMIYGV